jgi:hypothetical protein
VEISSLCPFCVSTLLWEAQPSQFSLTITVKATFRLVPGGEARIADVQEPLDIDRHWDDRPMASLFAPADVVPSKRKADVLVVGQARSLDIACGELNIEAREGARIAGKKVDIEAKHGTVAIKANDDVRVEGERVLLNSTDPPLPVSWDEFNERQRAAGVFHGELPAALPEKK